MTKICTKCGVEKSLEKFLPTPFGRYQVHSICRECCYLYNRIWRRKNKTSHYAKKLERVERNRKIVRTVKSKEPCTDCGKHFPWYAMDFDHVTGDKETEIGTMMPHCSVDRLLKEIAKCEVVCAVCHRIRTYIRAHSGDVVKDDSSN